jgi:uncharacterized protein YpuA (DUF1002 family)
MVKIFNKVNKNIIIILIIVLIIAVLIYFIFNKNKEMYESKKYSVGLNLKDSQGFNSDYKLNFIDNTKNKTINNTLEEDDYMVEFNINNQKHLWGLNNKKKV